MEILNLNGPLDWDGENDRDGYHHRVAAVGRRLGASLLGGSVYELPASADDQVELVAAGPRVRGQHAVAADDVVPLRTPLDRRARGAGAQSSPAQ